MEILIMWLAFFGLWMGIWLGLLTLIFGGKWIWRAVGRLRDRRRTEARLWRPPLKSPSAQEREARMKIWWEAAINKPPDGADSSRSTPGTPPTQGPS